MNRDSSKPFSLRSPGYGLALILTLAIALVPLWSAQIPPMLDYHNHLARQYVLANLSHSEFLKSSYHATWHVTWYLAMEVVVQALAFVMPIATAGKVFLSVMLLSLATAPLALNLALYGRLSPIALVALLMVHSMTLTFGFVYYLLGVGLALWLLALWIGVRDDRKWLRAAAFPVLSTFLFFTHFLGFAIYGLTAGAYEVGRYVERVRARGVRAAWRHESWQWRNIVALTIQGAVPLVVYWAVGTAKPEGNYGQNTYGGIWRKLDLMANIGPYLIPPYSWKLDSIIAVGLPIVLLGLLALRKLELSRRMAWPIGAMLLVYFLMPMVLIGGWGADHRFLVPIGLVFVGSLRLRSPSPMLWAAVYGLIGALVVVRVVAVTVEWRRANVEYAEFTRAFASLPSRTRVFFAFGHEGGQKIWPVPTYHLPLLAVASKEVYLPFMFAGPNITLQYQPDMERLQHLSPGPVLTHGQSPDWGALIGEFDYFLLVDERHFASAPPSVLTPVFRGDRIAIYRGPRGEGKSERKAPGG